MAQISKMSGTSWHVEEDYKTRVHTRNCVDCKYFQTEGRMCKKRMNMFRLTLQIIAITLIIYIDILLSLVKKQLTKIKSKRLSKKRNLLDLHF